MFPASSLHCRGNAVARFNQRPCLIPFDKPGLTNLLYFVPHSTVRQLRSDFQGTENPPIQLALRQVNAEEDA
jgi:hypothetical protein